MTCDLKLEGGLILDGTGSRGVEGDLAITNGRISAIGQLRPLPAAETVDCRGRIVTPGFIDIHSHSDWLMPRADAGVLVEPFIRQGMTTIVGGNCGFSPAPLTRHNRDAARSASKLIVDDAIELRWDTMDGFLAALEATPLPLNIAELVGHGTVRAAVTGALTPTPPNADELKEMERLTRAALDAGCVGVSCALGYPPGIFAAHDELAAFAAWAGDASKLFTSHLRAYSWTSPVYHSDPQQKPHNIEAIEEILAIAKAGGARVQISHLIFVGRHSWPTVDRAIETIERSCAEGLDVAFDAFPYTAGNTTASVLFPPEMLPHLESLLASPDALASVRAMGRAAFDQLGFSLEDIQIMHANAPAYDTFDGLFVGDAARRAGMDIWEFYARLVLESDRTARVLIHTYSGHDGEEAALRRVLAHPLCTIETDTFLTAHGHQNPASYGTFPRVLHTYVEQGLFSLSEAVRKDDRRRRRASRLEGPRLPAERLCRRHRGARPRDVARYRELRAAGTLSARH